MKKIWVKILSCFMAVNFMFMCFATSVFAGKVDYRLNGKRDGLDVVLRVMSEEEFKTLDKICEKGIFDDSGNFTKKYYDSRSSLATIFNKEVRSNYGHTLLNPFRNTEFNPGYGKILVDTAEKLNVYVPSYFSEDDVEQIEKQIIAKMMRKIRDKMLETEEGKDKWEKIEKDITKNANDLFKQGKISKIDYENMLKNGVVDSIFEIKSDIIWHVVFTYVTTNVLVGLFSIGGILLGTIAGPLAIPIVVFGIGDTNWQKTIGSVFYIALMRQKLQAEGRL